MRRLHKEHMKTYEGDALKPERHEEEESKAQAFATSPSAIDTIFTMSDTRMVVILGLGLMFAWTRRNDLISASKFGSSATDWCEDNYEHHASVAEWWNTVSNIGFVLSGIFGWGVIHACPSLRVIEPQVHLLFVLITVVGIGSALFHGTLSVLGQVMDELPIMLLLVYTIACLRPRHKWGNLAIRDFFFDTRTLVCTFVWVIIICVLYPVVCHAITLLLLPISAYAFLHEYSAIQDERTQKAHALTHGLFAATLGCFCTAVTLWLLDLNACEQVKGASIAILGFYPQFHAIWHLLMAWTFWGCSVTVMAHRVAGEGQTPTLMRDPVFNIMPYVVTIV